MGKHTSGPWYPKQQASGHGLVYEESTGKNVAVSYDASDVHLIAAAPELLEALKSCLAWMEHTIPNLKGPCPHCGDTVDAGGLNWGGPIGKARDAIANAEGGR